MDDELIHGPGAKKDDEATGPGVESEKIAQEKPCVEFDLNTTSPLVDLKHLLFRPRDYFASAGSLIADEKAVGFFWAKLFLTFFFCQWMGILSDLSDAGNFSFQFSVNGEAGRLDFIPFLADALRSDEMAELQNRLSVLPLLLKQALVFLIPFRELFTAALMAKIAQIGLGLFGNEKIKVSFLQLFFVTLVSRYFAILGLAPMGGAFFAWLLGVYFFLMGAKTLSGLSWGKTFVSTYVFSFVISTALVFVLGIVVVIFALFGALIFS